MLIHQEHALLLIGSLLLAFLFPFGIGMLLKKLRAPINEFVKGSANDNKRENATRHAELIELRAEKLPNFARMVGWGEMTFFCFVLFVLMNENNGALSAQVMYFLTIFGGYIGIKLFGSGHPWSMEETGKYYFYLSLLGTLLNIIPALLLAYSLSAIF